MKDLLSRLASRPLLTAELLIASLFVNLLALAMPLFVIQVLNRYVAHGVDATLATLAAGAVIAVLLEFFARQVRTELARGIGARADEEIANAGFGVLTAVKASVLDRIPPGQRREILEGAENVRAATSATNMAAVIDLPFAFLFIGALFLLSAELAAIAATFAALAFLFGLITMGTLRAPSRQLTQEGRERAGLLGVALQESDTVRAFNAGGALRRAWGVSVGAMHRLHRWIVARQGLAASLAQAVTALMGIAVISVGAILVVRGALDVGALIGANIIAARALQPIIRFAQMGEVFVKARESRKLLAEFARLPRELETGSAKREYQGRLELNDLAFAHHGASMPLFESLSVTAPSGTLLAVGGANGTGKTTLARLLMGLIEPNRGQVLVDGLDLRQVLPEWWRRQVVYLPQEPTFINATIADNVRILRPDADLALVNRVVQTAGLGAYVDELPGGLDTRLVDYGRNLALGIRRRLALARALMSDGKLAILDEPTEGLDAEGVKTIEAVALGLRERGRTVVVLSHDPGVLSGADITVDLNQKPMPGLVTAAAVPRADAMRTV